MQIGFPGLLFLLFLTLKLTGVIAWSWLWVTSPLWIATSIAVMFIGFCLLMAWVTGQLGNRKRRRI